MASFLSKFETKRQSRGAIILAAAQLFFNLRDGWHQSGKLYRASSAENRRRSNSHPRNASSKTQAATCAIENSIACRPKDRCICQKNVGPSRFVSKTFFPPLISRLKRLFQLANASISRFFERKKLLHLAAAKLLASQSAVRLRHFGIVLALSLTARGQNKVLTAGINIISSNSQNVCGLIGSPTHSKRNGVYRCKAVEQTPGT